MGKNTFTEKIFAGIPTDFGITTEQYMDFFNNPSSSNIFSLFENYIFNDPSSNFGEFYSLLGCKNVIKEITMNPFEVYELDLSAEIGEGELLYINYTSHGMGIIPVEMHSNTPIHHKQFNKKFLYPAYSEKTSTPTNVSLLYWYAPQDIKNDTHKKLMLDAFKCFYEEKWFYMIISLQTVLEIIQYEFLDEILQASNISKEKRNEFLSHNVTFSSQFKVLLPLIATISKFPLLPDKIIQNISMLISTRNKFIHNKREKPIVTKASAKSMLTAAFLLYKYYQIFSKKQ